MNYLILTGGTENGSVLGIQGTVFITFGREKIKEVESGPISRKKYFPIEEVEAARKALHQCTSRFRTGDRVLALLPSPDKNIRGYRIATPVLAGNSVIELAQKAETLGKNTLAEKIYDEISASAPTAKDFGALGEIASETIWVSDGDEAIGRCFRWKGCLYEICVIGLITIRGEDLLDADEETLRSFEKPLKELSRVFGNNTTPLCLPDLAGSKKAGRAVFNRAHLGSIYGLRKDTDEETFLNTILDVFKGSDAWKADIVLKYFS